MMKLKLTRLRPRMNITLCEQCFPPPQWGGIELLTIIPLSPCHQCGKYDERYGGSVKCHLFRGDPRPSE